MATSKAMVVSLLLASLFVLDLAQAQPLMKSAIIMGNKNSKQIDCGAACEVRCQLSLRPNLCKRACGTCCSRCMCVPPGTSGNQETCPCYASLTTHDGRKKCP